MVMGSGGLCVEANGPPGEQLCGWDLLSFCVFMGEGAGDRRTNPVIRTVFLWAGIDMLDVVIHLTKSEKGKSIMFVILDVAVAPCWVQ